MPETANIPENIDRLIGLEVNIDDLLGCDWKKTTLFSTTKSAFSEQETRTINSKREVKAQILQTGFEKRIIALNRLFTGNQSPYKAFLIHDEENNLGFDFLEKVLIQGVIAGDEIIQVVDAVKISGEDGEKKASYKVEKMWIRGQKGVLSLHGLLNNNEELILNEVQGRRYDENRQGYRLRDTKEVVVTLQPKNVVDMGTFFHELGHLFHKRYLRNTDHSLLIAHAIANEHYRSIDKPPFDIKTYQLRAVIAKEERGAWAIAEFLLKTLNREIGLQCGSPDNLMLIKRRSEEVLKNYNKRPHGHDVDEKAIPSFSRQQKIAAKRLHDLVIRMAISYRDLPNYNSEGQYIYNDPEALIKEIDKEGEKPLLERKQRRLEHEQRLKKEEEDREIKIASLMKDLALSEPPKYDPRTGEFIGDKQYKLIEVLENWPNI